MSNVSKNATIKALVNDVLTDLMIKTTGEQVYLDETTTASAKIAEMVLAINERAKTSDVTTAIDELRQEMLGDVPVEAYNTFTELATYIATHQEAADALTEAIGNKADKSTVDTIQATIDTLGSLATKSTVSEADLDTALKEKVNAASEGNHSHANKAVLDGITADKVAEWDSKGKFEALTADPENPVAGNLYVVITE